MTEELGTQGTPGAEAEATTDNLQIELKQELGKFGEKKMLYQDAADALDVYIKDNPDEELERLQTRKKEAKEILDNVGDIVRGFALAIYDITEEKTVHDAVKIKEFTQVTYQLADAFEWAKENAKYMLILDEKQFVKWAKGADLLPDFIEVGKEARAEIAGKVTKILGLE